MGNEIKKILSQSLFSFWAVGQGLFYSGELKIGQRNSYLPLGRCSLWDVLSHSSTYQFNFLYDIGSNKKGRLNQIVNRYFSNKKFNLCFISHFHDDHVNGLQALSKHNVHIERLIVPYVKPLELILLSIVSEDVWYTDFIMNPYLWILENLKVKTLYVWGYKKDSSLPPEDNVPSFDKYQSPELVENIEDNEALKHDFDKNYPLVAEYRGRIKFAENGSYFQVKNLWLFCPFCLEAEEAKLKEFKELLNKDGIDVTNDVNWDIIKSKRKEIKKRYEEVFNKDINFTSLTLYHQPLIDKYSLGWTYVLPFCRAVSGRKLGQFLMGDINLTSNKRYKNFQNFYNSYLKKALLVQVPHHGSSDNWSKNFLNEFSARYWVISAGKKHKYHPSREVISDIWGNEQCPIWIHDAWEKDRLLIKQLICHWQNH